MNRHSAGSVIVLSVLGLGVGACSSGGSNGTALPTISAVASAAPSSPGGAPTSSPPAATQPSPSVKPTLISETIAPASGLASYTNARFGFSVSYPASLKESTAPVDGDGAVFTATDGTMLRVSGVNNNNNESVDAVYTDATTPASGSTITYKNKSGNVVTVSGTKEGDVVFYVRTTVGTGSIDSLEWDYPAASKATYDPLVTATVKSYKPGDVSQTH